MGRKPKESKNSDLRLDEASQLAYMNDRECARSSSNVSRILAGVYRSHQRGWACTKELNFGCEHRDYGDLSLPCVSAVPEISAVIWMIELMTDLLEDKFESDYPSLYPNAAGGLKKTKRELAKFRRSMSNAEALEFVTRKSKNNRLMDDPSFLRVDIASDHSALPNFSNRLFQWFLACLKIQHPVLFLCPLITNDQNRTISMFELDSPAQIPVDDNAKMYVPAVAYDATSEIFSSTHLPVYQHGIRCRLFLPNKECSFKTLPDYFFRGWIKDCWFLTDKPWLDCIN